MTILITYADQGGPSTRSLGLVIAHELIKAGHNVDFYPCDRAQRVRDYDAVVVGSAVQHHRWQPEAASFLRRNAADLAERPTYLFQTGTSSNDIRPETAQNIADPIHRIGIAGPQTFDTVGDAFDEQRESVAAWGRQIGLDLGNRLEVPTSGMWESSPMEVSNPA